MLLGPTLKESAYVELRGSICIKVLGQRADTFSEKKTTQMNGHFPVVAPRSRDKGWFETELKFSNLCFSCGDFSDLTVEGHGKRHSKDHEDCDGESNAQRNNRIFLQYVCHIGYTGR